MTSAPTRSQQRRLHGRAAAAFSAVLLLVATAPARAQDVMQVGADTHSVLLENARVRVLAAHVPPGGKVPMHSHPANVIYFFGDAMLRITLPDGRSRVVPIKAATAMSNGPLTHAIENIGTTGFSEMQVELKDAAPAH
jgi:uncharacterized membrane protein